MYFQAFTQVLLSYEQYTVGMPAPNCDGVCRSFLIPGGLETARALNGSLLNSTLLEGGLFQDHEAIGNSQCPRLLAGIQAVAADLRFRQKPRVYRLRPWLQRRHPNLHKTGTPIS
jgi:hypothetical protein